MQHHAYLLCGRGHAAREYAFSLCDLSPESRIGNPDVQVHTFEQLTIDDARLLKEWAAGRPVVLPRRIFIIEVASILHEAQNALLKLFEEPPERSVFILIVPSVDRLLPTLRSRFEYREVSRTAATTNAALAFLELSLAARQKEIADRLKVKDSEWVDTLLASLEAWAQGDEQRDMLRDILFVEGYINRRGSSPKMLLEHLALSLP